jgi:hypothetical protein
MDVYVLVVAKKARMTFAVLVPAMVFLMTHPEQLIVMFVKVGKLGKERSKGMHAYMHAEKVIIQPPLFFFVARAYIRYMENEYVLL